MPASGKKSRRIGSLAPGSWHSHTGGGAWGSPGGAPCGAGEGAHLEEEGAGERSPAEEVVASGEGRKSCVGVAWRSRSAVCCPGVSQTRGRYSERAGLTATKGLGRMRTKHGVASQPLCHHRHHRHHLHQRFPCLLQRNVETAGREKKM